MSWSRILGSATLMAFVLSLTVVSAESAVPNAQNKKFYACMNKRTRLIKMLNYPKVKTCPRRHKRISWNAKGNSGVAGPAGPAGPMGAAGPAGITNIHITIKMGPSRTPLAGNSSISDAVCDAGIVVGGGYLLNGDLLSFDEGLSYPSSPTTWRVWGYSSSGMDTFNAYAVCMTTTPGAVIASKNSDFGPAVKKPVGSSMNGKKTFKPAKKGKKKRR